MKSKKLPSFTSEVVVDWSGKASEKAAQKGWNALTSHKSPTTPQTKGVEMVEEANDDNDYITKEDFVEGYQHFKLPQGAHSHFMT